MEEAGAPEKKLTTRVAALAAKEGVDFLGVADLARAYEVVDGMRGKSAAAGKAKSAGLPRVVSLGCRTDDVIIDVLPNDAARYGKHFYGEIWPKAKRAAAAVAALLTKEGFKAAACNSGGLMGLPKMAARLAGLGWIGKSSLLITPEAGPRVIWETVLTDAPLPVTASEPPERRCGTCRRCVDICPVKAYVEGPFDERDPIAKRFDRGKCQSYRSKLGMFGAGACGLCVQVCPFGRKDELGKLELQQPGAAEEVAR